MLEEIEKIKRELEEAKETIRIKDQRIIDLTNKMQDLRKKLDILQRERPKLKPENLISSFKTALEKMQEGLRMGEGRVDYMVSKFDIDLKVNVTLDEQGNINFQLPKLEDVIPSENLSTLSLSIKPVPKVLGPPPDTVEVPNLIGMLKDVALESIKKAKLKEGKITERVSLTAPGTVIEQDPVPYSRTLIGSPIDLIISKVREVKVPNLIGMDKDNAIDIIRISKLAVGKITEEVSDSPPGTVFSQSITADTLVPVGTAIDLLIAKPKMVSVPDVIGKKIKDARKIIGEAKLRVGKITKEPSGELKDTVIKQSPEAGKNVSVRTAIDLVIARPKKYIKPEDVPEEEAKRVLDFLNSAKTAKEIADAVKFSEERDVGVKIAQHILNARAKLGGFTHLKQVDSIPQVGHKRFSDIVNALRLR
jgi:serine/threonine-protein kinase